MARRIFDSNNGNEINESNNIDKNASQEVNKEPQESEFKQKIRELSQDEVFMNTLKALNEERYHCPIVNLNDMPKSSQECRIEELQKKLDKELKMLRRYFGR